jgi:HSP20 family protein
MFGSFTGFDRLLDELRRWDAGWDDLLAGSPWVSGLRSAGWDTYPPINVAANPESVDVYLFAAGVDPESLTVSVAQSLLTVTGERKPAPEEKATWYRRERFSGAFQRTVVLPEDLDPDKVEARYRDGVLHVRVARREEVRPRRIQVH